MKIGINGFEAIVPRFGYDENGRPKRVGSSEVCFQWLKELERIDKKNEYSIYLPSDPTKDMPKERDGWSYIRVPGKKLWTILGLSKVLRKNKNLDVFLSPTHYGPLFISIPQVISILDVSYKYFPELFKKKDLYQLALWGRYSISRASKIITISESSRDDIINEYHVSGTKVDVAYLGIKDTPESFMDKSEIKNKFGIDSPYILFVGTLQPRKNIVRLIEAFSKIENSQKLKLVIVGRKGWQYESILDAPKRYGIEERVLFLENVTDEQLPSFYKEAELFVLPSLYEGFGLPVLEAMKYGCPVITSNISSLPEAGGNAAIYFDPDNVDDIADKMKMVLEDSSLKDKMVKEGYEQVKKFSWEKSARKVLEVLESVKE